MFNFAEIVTPAGLAVLLQVILIDLTMAGDNVVIMGALTSGLPARERRKVIMLGVAIAVVFLIAFALVATQLLKITGLLLAGGLLLMWVAYNMFRELRRPSTGVAADDPATAEVEGPPASKTFLQAAVQVTLADLSMSLDNVLAVAAAARNHPSVLFVGLVLSVTFMGVAASFVAKLIHRFPLLAWAGLLMILYVALKMIWEGWHDVAPLLG
jgi:YjbE family integral membrane protein